MSIISNIVEYKHISLILAAGLFCFAYIDYTSGKMIRFYLNLIIGTIMIIAYIIIRLKQLKKTKVGKENE